MSTFDLLINFIEALLFTGFIYNVFHKRKGLSLLFVFVFIKATITTIHNYYLLPELSLTVLSHLTLFLYAFLLNRKNIIQNIFIVFLIYTLSDFSITTSMIMTNIFFKFPFYQGNAYIFLAILSICILSILSYIIYRMLNKSTIAFNRTNKIISILVVLFILKLLYSSVIELIFYNSIFDIYVILILLLINILVIALLYTFLESQREQTKVLKLQEDNLKNENKIKIDNINKESIKHLTLWKHDINYVFTYLKNYVENHKYEEALRTISTYSDILNNYNLFIDTNNDTLNSVLIDYTGKIIQNNIHVYVDTDHSKVPFSTKDYQQILYMFFDHAVNNCESDYQNEIWVSYYTQSPYFVLNLEYTSFLYSITTIHNYINHVIDKYNGRMKFDNQNNKNILKIIIPMEIL